MKHKGLIIIDNNMQDMINDIIKSNGELMIKVLEQQKDEQLKTNERYFKTIKMAFICFTIALGLFVACIMYNTYQQFDYDGGSYVNSKNGNIEGNGGTLTNYNKEAPITNPIPKQ